jgi:biotin transporter BioY
MDPSLDISEFEGAEVQTEKKEVIFVQIGLSVLSGFLFGFIWLAFILKSAKELAGTKKRLLCWILSCLVPFASIFVFLKLRRDLLEAAKARGIDMKISKAALIISAILLPIAPVNVVALSLIQHKINKLYA